MGKIFHISDVHIRNTGRREEYEQVFKNLQTEIASRIEADDVIVVTGDIVDAKNRITVENVRLQTKFYSMLHTFISECDAHVVIIPGNHDVYYKNTNQLNSTRYLTFTRRRTFTRI